MSTTRKAPGTLVTTLVAVALAAPAAGAMPLHQPSEFNAGHATGAMSVAAARQDLRSADARDAAMSPRPKISHVSAAPVQATPAQPTHDGGTPWLTIVLGAAGALTLGGAVAGASHSTRVRARRAGVAA